MQEKLFLCFVFLRTGKVNDWVYGGFNGIVLEHLAGYLYFYEAYDFTVYLVSRIFLQSCLKGDLKRAVGK